MLKEKIKVYKEDLLVVLIGFVCLFLYDLCISKQFERSIIISTSIFLMIVVLNAMPVTINKDTTIYKNKKALFAFICMAVALQVIGFIGESYLGGVNNELTNTRILQIRLFKLVLTSLVFLGYFWGLRLSTYKWNIDFKTFKWVFFIYIAYSAILLVLALINGSFYFNLELVKYFVVKTINYSLYPAFFEEVLYRGFLITGLKGLGWSDTKCNVVQSIIFGIAHFTTFGALSWIVILSLATQTMLGYVLGKLYFKSKSLLPSILLHGLLDIVLPF